MSKYDPEIEQLKAGVNCAALLERMGGGYKLDERESSRQNLKYRRGAGEIIIINHDGKGWWDPGSNAKGDVFSLAQHLDPSLNFGRVRGVLRQMLGVAPSFPAAERPEKEKKPSQPPTERWRSRPPISQGSRTWLYLTGERQLPAEVVIAAIKADAVREGPYASAWFAHRDERGGLTGIEMRGPNYRGFSEDGNKTLFRLQPRGSDAPTRLAVLEAPIDAMSLAALEGMRRDTLYVATAGGMGPGTITGLEREIAGIAARGGVLVAATDADPQGEKYAARLTAMAEAAGIVAERAAPIGHKDWNEALKAEGQAPARQAHPRFSKALADVARAMEWPQPARRPPWEPVPVRMAERVRVIEQRDAMAAAEAMAARNISEPAPGADQRRAPSPGPGAQP